MTPTYTDDEIAEMVEKRPWAALKFVADRLTPEQRKYCEERTFGTGDGKMKHVSDLEIKEARHG